MSFSAIFARCPTETLAESGDNRTGYLVAWKVMLGVISKHGILDAARAATGMGAYH